MFQYSACPALVNDQTETLLQPRSTPVPKEEPVGQDYGWILLRLVVPRVLENCLLNGKEVTFPTCRALPYGFDHMSKLDGLVGDSYVNISNLRQARHNMT